MHAEKEICIPCLLRGITDEAYEEIISNYIASMDEDMKASDSLYAQRLGWCRKCEFLRNGICRLCGCFVAARAAKKQNRCADVPAKW